MRKGYYSRQARTATTVENEEKEGVIDEELLRLMRSKLRRVSHSLQFEFGGFALLDESDYLCTKGTLEYIDVFCVTNDIYAPEECTNSSQQLEFSRTIKKALLNYSKILS